MPTTDPVDFGTGNDASSGSDAASLPRRTLMYINALSPEVRPELRSRVIHTLFAIGSALLMSLPSAAFAQSTTVCGPEVKEEVAKLVAGLENGGDAAKVATESDIYKMFEYCGLQDA